MKRFCNIASDNEVKEVSNEDRETLNKEGRLAKRQKYLLEENMVSDLNEMNAIPRDKEIVLDEPTHIYYLPNGKTADISATTLISEFMGKFRAQEKVWSLYFKPNKYRKNRYDSEFRLRSGNYKGMTKGEILNMWNNTGTFGTECHAIIERFLLAYPKFNNPTAKTDKARAYRIIRKDGVDSDEVVGNEFNSCLKQFLEWEKPYLLDGWEPFYSERMVYMDDEEFGFSLAGSIDAIYTRQKEGEEREYMLADWKTTSSDFKKKYPAAEWPIDPTLKSGKVANYSIQLAIYKFLLEKYYDMKNIRVGYIVKLNPMGTKAEEYEALWDLVDVEELFTVYGNQVKFAKKCQSFVEKGYSNEFKLFPTQKGPSRYQNDKEYL